MIELDKAKKEFEIARDNYTQLMKIHENQLVAQKHLQKELEQMEIGRGDRVIDALMVDNADNVAWAESQAVMGKKAQLDTANDVLDALIPRIREAMAKVIECKSICLNEEANELDDQANQRQPKTDELLRQLEDWEGCKYAPAYSIKEVEPSRFKAGGSYRVIGLSATDKLKKQASYYRECAENLKKNIGYSIDIMGDGSPIYPLPAYLSPYNECQPSSI